jgi:hypothetical protein
LYLNWTATPHPVEITGGRDGSEGQLSRERFQ